MAIQTSGTISIDADRKVAFSFVSDPSRLARCVPGCRDPQEISPGRYAAVVTNKVAFISLSFKVIVEIERIEPPDAIQAKITGDAVGLSGHVVASASLQLASDGDGRTAIHYSTHMALTGKLGGLGESVFRAKTAELAGRFAANLKSAIENQPREQRA